MSHTYHRLVCLEHYFYQNHELRKCVSNGSCYFPKRKRVSVFASIVWYCAVYHKNDWFITWIKKKIHWNPYQYNMINIYSFPLVPQTAWCFAFVYFGLFMTPKHLFTISFIECDIDSLALRLHMNEDKLKMILIYSHGVDISKWAACILLQPAPNQK